MKKLSLEEVKSILNKKRYRMSDLGENLHFQKTGTGKRPYLEITFLKSNPSKNALRFCQEMRGGTDTLCTYENLKFLLDPDLLTELVAKSNDLDIYVDENELMDLVKGLEERFEKNEKNDTTFKF